ncbi:MAG: hypothetical protein M3040_02105 [Bacteroidota bacterium]|nr:hypothetical protein [Bacteroidota bacterium]
MNAVRPERSFIMNCYNLLPTMNLPFTSEYMAAICIAFKYSFAKPFTSDGTLAGLNNKALKIYVSRRSAWVNC